MDITLILPEWLAWLLAISFVLLGVQYWLDLFIRFLNYRLKQLKLSIEMRPEAETKSEAEYKLLEKAHGFAIESLSPDDFASFEKHCVTLHANRDIRPAEYILSDI